MEDMIRAFFFRPHQPSAATFITFTLIALVMVGIFGYVIWTISNVDEDAKK